MTGRDASGKLGALVGRQRVATESQLMPAPDYAIGQAVFIRTDTPDYKEEVVPFKSPVGPVRWLMRPR